MSKIPENSARNSPPEDLQTTSFECGCGQTFESAQALGEHTVDCDEADASDLAEE